MKLSGHKRSAGKRSGGIRTVLLVGSDSIEGIEYNKFDDAYSNIELSDDATFARYHFREDGAAYEETATWKYGNYLVEHKLTMLIERLDNASTATVEELADASADGIVAIITTNNGVSFLVGYSSTFETERGLRLVSSTGTTGEKLSDTTAEVITLVSHDSAKAKLFVGMVPFI